jgi:hypothetical protein
MMTTRARHACRVALTAFTLVTVAQSLGAQAAPPKPAKADSAKAGGMTHDMSGMGNMADMKGMHMMPGKKEAMPSSGWKELDAYHALMQATWHPADEYGDIAPIRAKATALAASAKALAASTPPKRCAAPKLLETAKALAPQSQTVAEMVQQNATNNQIKDSLKALHERFEVLEMGCGAEHAKGK